MAGKEQNVEPDLTDQLCYYKEGPIRVIVQVKSQVQRNNHIYANLEILASADGILGPKLSIGAHMNISWATGYKSNQVFYLKPLKAYDVEDAIVQIDPKGRMRWFTSNP